MNLKYYLTLQPGFIVRQIEKAPHKDNLFAVMYVSQYETILTLFSLTPAPLVITSMSFPQKVMQRFCFVPNKSYLQFLLFAQTYELVFVHLEGTKMRRTSVRIRSADLAACRCLAVNRQNGFCVTCGQQIYIGLIQLAPYGVRPVQMASSVTPAPPTMYAPPTMQAPPSLQAQQPQSPYYPSFDPQTVQNALAAQFTQIFRLNCSQNACVCAIDDYFVVGVGSVLHFLIHANGQIQQFRTLDIGYETQYLLQDGALLYALCDKGIVVVLKEFNLLKRFEIGEYDFSLNQQVKVDTARHAMCIASGNGWGGCIMVNLETGAEKFQTRVTGVYLGCEFGDGTLILGEGNCLKMFRMSLDSSYQK